MRYLGKKIITLIMTLFLVSVAAFLAFQIIPGDVVTSILGTEATPEREEQLREELGLDKPPLERYVSWVNDVAHGDFGVSYRYSKNMNEMMSVKELIGDKLPGGAVPCIYCTGIHPLRCIMGQEQQSFPGRTFGGDHPVFHGDPFLFPGSISDLSVRYCVQAVHTGRICKL